MGAGALRRSRPGSAPTVVVKHPSEAGRDATARHQERLRGLEARAEKVLIAVPDSSLAELPGLKEEIRLVQAQLVDLEACTSVRPQNANAKGPSEAARLRDHLHRAQAALKERELLLEGMDDANAGESSPVVCIAAGRSCSGSQPTAQANGRADSSDNEGNTPHQSWRKQNAKYSKASLASLDILTSLDQQLSALENRAAEIIEIIKVASGIELAALKTELAQLESRAKQLEGRGVDDVYTSELVSGKEEAKVCKKDMLQRFEALFDRIDETFLALRRSGQ